MMHHKLAGSNLSNIRVLVCTDPGTVHSIRFINSLAKRCKVALFWYGEERNYSQTNVPCFPIFGKESIRVRGGGLLREFAFISTILLYKPDLIHVHRESRWCSSFKRYAPQIPLIFTTWGHISDKLLSNRWGSHIAFSDGITGDAQTLIDELRVIRGCENKPSLIFRFGVNEDSFKPSQNPIHIKKKLSIPPDGRIVYSPRSLRSIYNHETMIMAINRILDKHPSTYFLFVNNHGHRYPDSVEYKDKLLGLVTNMGVEDKVLFLDHEEIHEKVAERYQAADVVVSIPLNDGFPVTILEAMACGVPLVVSALDDYRDVVDDTNAIRVCPTDSREVANAIIKLLSSSKERTKLIQAGLKTFNEKGRMVGELDKLLAFYEMFLVNPT